MEEKRVREMIGTVVSDVNDKTVTYNIPIQIDNKCNKQ